MVKARKQSKSNNSAILGFEQTLWQAATIVRTLNEKKPLSR